MIERTHAEAALGRKVAVFGAGDSGMSVHRRAVDGLLRIDVPGMNGGDAGRRHIHQDERQHKGQFLPKGTFHGCVNGFDRLGCDLYVDTTRAGKFTVTPIPASVPGWSPTALLNFLTLYSSTRFNMATMETMTRGKLARLCGVGPETIRFYERRGLLPEAPRSDGGYRRFGEDAMNRLIFIRRAKNLGFSLPEIAELLSLHDDPGGNRARVKQITESKLREIESKIADLGRMRSTLSDVADQCSGHGPVSGCPIIEAIAGEPGGQQTPANTIATGIKKHG